MTRRAISDRHRIVQKQVVDEYALRHCLNLAADEIGALERKLTNARQKIKRLELRLAKTGERPCIQVIEFWPELGHSIWVDFMSRCRTREGLEKRLRRMVRKGEIVGYRIGSAREVIGYVPKKRETKAATGRNKSTVCQRTRRRRDR